MFSWPPVNHFANGRSHSRVVSKGLAQLTRSRAMSAQNSSKSRSAASYRSAVALALAAKSGDGGNVRFSARSASISGFDVDGSMLTENLLPTTWAFYAGRDPGGRRRRGRRSGCGLCRRLFLDRFGGRAAVSDGAKVVRRRRGTTVRLS